MNKQLGEYSKNELLSEIKRRGKVKTKSIFNSANPSQFFSKIAIYTNLRNFKVARKQFSQLLTSLETIGKEPYLMPFWSNVNKKVKLSLLPEPPINFLSDRVIIDTMFVEGSQQWLDNQIHYLRRRLSNYTELVREESIGKPKLLTHPNQYTSHNAIHHLYHQEFFADKTNVNLSKINSVVEWGGGYGSFARIWIKRFKKSNQSLTYTIIDSSLFCSIQWLYLCSIFGGKNINILKTKKDIIIKGKINLVPLALLESTKIKGDLFVSTWGLSESAKEAQDYVIKHKWFNAKHILIGFQDSYKDLPYAERLGQIAKKDGAKIYDIDFIPKNHYAIK